MKKARFIITLNIMLMLVIAGIVISFFITAFERENSSSFVRAQSMKALSETELAGALSVQNALRYIGEANRYSVVNISTLTVVEMRNPYEEFFGEDFFRYFFGEDAPHLKKQIRSLGSGFIIDESGYLLSNLHVVKNASKIFVRFYGEEEEYEAQIIGVDEDSDLALLKVKADRTFIPVRLGDSENISMGDFAIAIGNPYGLNNTMTMGIVSARGRSDISTGNRYQRFIQVDVPINPGNSGGPLFNIRGEVIGVNSMIYSSRGGGNIGIGFAIPINLAKKVMVDLKERGRVRRGYLGVTPQDISSKELANALGIGVYAGVYVAEVMVNSPAEKAGIRDGDIIISFDGKALSRSSDLHETTSLTEIGKRVEINILRRGKKIKVYAVIEEKPGAVNTAVYGMTLGEITDTIKRKLSLRSDEWGVVILSVENYSAAAKAGIRAGDIIKRVDGEDTKSVSALLGIINTDKNKKRLFLIKRGRFLLAITLTP